MAIAKTVGVYSVLVRLSTILALVCQRLYAIGPMSRGAGTGIIRTTALSSNCAVSYQYPLYVRRRQFALYTVLLITSLPQEIIRQYSVVHARGTTTYIRLVLCNNGKITSMSWGNSSVYF